MQPQPKYSQFPKMRKMCAAGFIQIEHDKQKEKNKHTRQTIKPLAILCINTGFGEEVMLENTDAQFSGDDKNGFLLRASKLTKLIIN